MNNSGLISIIIPTFNRVGLVQETLNSIHAQQYENWECIVVDDHSTDDTLDVLQSYHTLDPRFQFYSNTRKKGAPGARNTGLEKASGEFVFFFDSDNLMKANALQELVNAFNNNLIDICTCHAEVVDDSFIPVGSFSWNNIGNIHDQLISGSTYVDYNIALIRKSALDRMGFTDEDCPAFQEWDTHLRLSEFCEYYTVKEKLIIYRKSEKDTISSNKFQSTKGFLYILNKHQNSFSKFPYLFKKQGLKLLKSAQQTEDADFVHEVKKELSKLIPGFQQYIVSIRMQDVLQKIQDKLKKHLRKSQ